jgi:hypothetical protein
MHRKAICGLWKEQRLKETQITCKLTFKVREDQMIAGGFNPLEESPGSAGRDGR